MSGSKMEYKDKLDAFKSSCRVYKLEKNKLNMMLKENGNDAARDQYIRYVKADVEFVEKTFQIIEEKCGPNARVLIWEMFVENKTQSGLAAEYGITRRQLQYSLDKWMHTVLENEEDVPS